MFDNIRENHPAYSIAIFYVYASEAEIRKRIALRAEQTGRDVPEEQLRSSLIQPDRSLRLLTPKVDFVARINNEGTTPVLEAFEVVDHSRSWNAIAKRFAKKRTLPSTFPASLRPMYLSVSSLTHEDFEYDTPEEDDITCVVLRIEAVRKYVTENTQSSDIQALEFVWSPSSVINMDPESRDAANVPSDAHSFVYCYPVHTLSQAHLKPGNESDFIIAVSLI